jgi:O-antigen/teichoic acid export membrane protein
MKMIYWGLGCLLLAVTMLILATVVGMHGAGGIIDIALIASLALLAGGTLTRHHHRHKHVHFRLPGR